MLGKNITIRGIFTTILFITIGVTQVVITIENVDTDDAGCIDSQDTTQSACEADNCGTTSGQWYTGT